jgi:hypothetical protein
LTSNKNRDKVKKLEGIQMDNLKSVHWPKSQVPQLETYGERWAREVQERRATEFFNAYVTAALWSSNDESTPAGGEPLDSNYTATDLAPETAAAMRADCEKFQAECALQLAEDHRTPARAACGYTVEESAGHDFWLTRNGHGAGFWDGDWMGPAAAILTAASHTFGEFNLYIGDDGQIWGQ